MANTGVTFGKKDTNPKNWFYTCVLGDTRWLMPGNTLKYFGIPFEVHHVHFWHTIAIRYHLKGLVHTFAL